MKTLARNNFFFPSFLDSFIAEERLDSVNNYETFSIPAVNIIETFPNFVVELAAPGFEKDNFAIEVVDNTLKITSNREEEKTEENEKRQFTRREFNYQSFERSFTLPENIDTENIKAEYENGILRISLPRIEEKKALKRMVEIS